MALSNNFNSRAIFDGLQTKAKLEETPDTFGTRNKVAQQSNPKRLDRNSRMAITDMSRKNELETNPEADAAMMSWMTAFGYSPEANKPGSWNEAKLQGQNPYLNSEPDDPGPEPNEGEDTLPMEA